MTEFDDIRPFADAEVETVVQHLLADDEFISFVGKYRAPLLYKLFPGLVKRSVRNKLAAEMGDIDSVEKFQQLISGYVARLIKDSITSFGHSGVERLDKDKGYLFIGNHRDIAADSMLLDYALYLSGFDTVRIAIGDNLLQRQFSSDLMRLNKSFIIKRSAEGAKNIYRALLQSSSYIKKSIQEDSHSVWIAQSEGRAKDGMDLTDPALIKMIVLSQRKYPGSYAELIRSMNIVPVSVSYEFDPCDLLKAKELYHLDKLGGYTKPSGEDLLSLVKGLSEFKGRVQLSVGEPLGGELSSPEEVAVELDRQILSGYKLFPANYLALSLIADEPYADIWQSRRNEFEKNFTRSDQVKFKKRLSACPLEHQAYFLRMYANPIINRDNYGID